MQHTMPRDELQRRNRRALITAYEWISAMVMAMVMISVLVTFVVRLVMVDGPSMLPTLQNGDRLLLTGASDVYKPGEIVVVDRYTEDPLIKRVVAVPGDVVEITPSCELMVNGKVQNEPYIQGATVPRDMTGPQKVPEGCVFVLGDNRSVSKDSRMEEVGMVSVKDIVGKAVFRLWPPASFGRIDKVEP